MKNRNLIFGLLMICPLILFSQNINRYHEYFYDNTMRVDYYHFGDNDEEWISIDKVYKEGEWAGTRTKLIDPENIGKYRIRIYDSQMNDLLYSRGFNSYFGEYQTTAKAAKGIKRAFHESALFPFPRNKVFFTIAAMNRQNTLVTIFKQEIDPQFNGIIKEPADADIILVRAHESGSAHKSVDLAIIGEGYSAREEEKFRKDLRHFSEILLNFEPYKSYKDRFNIYGILKLSQQSGCDEPTHNIFKNTSISATFNSMGSPRYLLTEDNKVLSDVARIVPYDALLIMVNHQRYGGGGIYNFYLTFTTDNVWKDYVFIHEFGHSFAGLADEYYSSSTAYDEFYPAGIEPLARNITALINPGELKWKHLMDSNTPLPTPWNKTEYDSLNADYQKIRKKLNDKVAMLVRDGAPEEQVDEARRILTLTGRQYAARIDSLIKLNKYWNKVGAFEGAGYVSQGLYRPMLDCIMYSKGNKPFCKVCENAIIEMIEYYTE